MLTSMAHPEAKFDIGIVGGGQLGRMLALAAAPLDLTCLVLDPDPACPASIAAATITAPLSDHDALRRLVSSSRVTTFEIEHTDPAALAELERAGHRFAPSPRVLRTVADKHAQKLFLRDGGIPVPALLDRAELIDPGTRTLRRAAVQKTRFGGYDGRGVAVVAAGDEPPLTGATFFEEVVSIDRELAVVVARATSGDIAVYEPVEMVFDPVLNLVSDVMVPANVLPEIRDTAVRVARATADRFADLGLVGLMAVELFLTTAGHIVVNEVAPRPHNSGHLTIEAHACSQFEQHIRCVAGFPLGSVGLLGPAAMTNILGPSSGPTGRYRVAGRPDALAVEESHLHLYGKSTIRPGRKMGHVTARGTTTAEALARAKQSAAAIRFDGEPERNQM